MTWGANEAPALCCACSGLLGNACIASARSVRLSGMKRTVHLLAVLLVLAACSKQNGIPEVTPESVPVLAVLELPSGRSLGIAAQVLDAVQPGASEETAASISTVLANAAEVGSLHGADLDKPVRAVMLDPSKYPNPVLLLVSVSDADELAMAVGKDRLLLRNDLALVGAPEAGSAAHDYAFGTLGRRKAPVGPQATIYVQPVRDVLLGAMLTMMGDGPDDRVFNFCIDRVLAVSEQTDRVEAHVATQGALSGVELIVHPRPETIFARFNQAQSPSDLALAEMLPAHEAPVMFMAGSLAMGPDRQAIHDTGNALMAATWGLATTEETGDWFGPFMDLFTGALRHLGYGYGYHAAGSATHRGQGWCRGRAPCPEADGDVHRQGHADRDHGHEADHLVHTRGVHPQRRHRDDAADHDRDRAASRRPGNAGCVHLREQELFRRRGRIPWHGHG